MDFNQNWYKTGTDITEFFNEVANLASITTCETIDTEDLSYGYIYSDSDMNEICSCSTLFIKEYEDGTNLFEGLNKRLKEKDKLGCIFFRDGSQPTFKSFSKASMREQDVSDDLFLDLCNESKTILINDGQVFLVSPIAVPSLLNRASVSGDSMFAPSYGRTMQMYTALTHKRPQTCSFIVRKNPKTRTKVLFAAHSNSYKYVRQTVLQSVYDSLELGIPTCHKWHISHRISCCYLDYKDKAKELADTYKLPIDVVPGVYLATSDTGDCALTVAEYFKIGNSIIIGKSVTKKHTKNASAEFEKEVNETIFADYRCVPERLCELLTIDVDGKDIKSCIKSVFSQIQLNKVLGKKERELLTSALVCEFSPSKTYTAYDVALAIITAGDRMVEPKAEYKNQKASEALYKAVFANYSISKTKVILS